LESTKFKETGQFELKTTRTIMLLLSLGLYLYWLIISPRWYHPPSDQCFDIDIV